MGSDKVEKMEKQEEESSKKYKYPKSVIFIVGNEFCERFSFYGMKAILTLYLKYVLLFTEDTSTVIYHVFSMFCYFTPIFGAMLADTILGKFRTILYISILYAAGNVILSLAATDPIGLPQIPFSMIGLAMIALGTGGIKPCVSAFGGDQFVLPQQERQLQRFFSIFYFSINAGSLISTFFTPILREDVECFGNDTCYPLAFGVPAILMIVALLLFVFGKPLYVLKPPEGNIVMKVGSCIKHAIARKITSHVSREHWLDYADDKYSRKLIGDVKAVLRVLFLYLPLPVFWALFDQQGSRWTFQATRMDGEVGSYIIKPDQMQVINPFLILALIPVFESIIYPIFSKCNIFVKSLQRIAVGGILAGIAFVVSGLLELRLEQTYPVIPKIGEAQLTLINALPCHISIEHSFGHEFTSMAALEQKTMRGLPADPDKLNHFPIKIKMSESCHGVEVTVPTYEGKINALSAHAYTVMITVRNKALLAEQLQQPDLLEKTNEGNPKIRIMYHLDQTQPLNTSFLIREVDGGHLNYTLSTSDPEIGTTEYAIVDAATYEVFMKYPDGHWSQDPIGSPIKLKQGGVFNLLLQKSLNNTEEYNEALYTMTEPNSLHMLWLIPQYFIITTGEVMFSITGLEFSFTQAPSSMKSVVQAAWLLTVAFGNLIVVIIAEAKFFDRQANEFFLFAGLMFADMLVFMVMAYFYKYVDLNEHEEEEPKKKDGRDNDGYEDEDTQF